MTVTRPRAIAGIATAFALFAVAAPGGVSTALLASSGGTDDAAAPAPSPSGTAFPVGELSTKRPRGAVEVPSVSARSLAVASQTVVSKVSSLGPGKIPDRALAAYAFAAQAMQEADPTCDVDWATLAAIGRIESNHGRDGAAELRRNGRVAPVLRSDALDGSGAAPKVRDTDRGRFDGDERFDRALGPMQLLPATWSYVGVDGDGNGLRSPDDIDDAALAVGVYLCAAADEAEAAGKQAADATDMERALSWFNPSPAYTTLALRLEKAYGKDYGSTPYSVAPDPLRLEAVSLGGDADPVDVPARALAARAAADARKAAKDAKQATEAEHEGTPTTGGRPSGTGGTPAQPTTPPTTTDPVDGSGAPGDPSTEPSPEPEPEPTPEPTPTIPAPVPGVMSGALTVCGDYYCIDGVAVEAGIYGGILQGRIDQAIAIAVQATADAQAAADAAAEQAGTEPETVDPVEPVAPQVTVDVHDTVDDAIDPDDDMPRVIGVR